MKKFALILVAIVFTVSLIGCNKTDKENEDIYVTDDITYDYDEFMSLYVNRSDSSVNNTSTNQIKNGTDIVLPTLKSNDYYCARVRVGEYRHTYYYYPSGKSQNSMFLRTEGISVTVTPGDDVFYSDLESDNFLTKYFSEEYAVNETSNIWFINRYGKTIVIQFPYDVEVSTPEEIGDYFEFEVLNPSNDNTVTE